MKFDKFFGKVFLKDVINEDESKYFEINTFKP